MSLLGSEDLNLPSSLVTVWGASEVFVHTTVVPFVTVTVSGLKEYFPLFSTMFIWAEFVDVDSEVGITAGVDSEAAGVVVSAGALAGPPQAVSIRAAIVASKEIKQ